VATRSAKLQDELRLFSAERYTSLDIWFTTSI
jgi:hypothetical protein